MIHSRKKYGLIGYPLGHSFSRRYFSEKFARLGLADTHVYELYPLESIDDFSKLLAEQEHLAGLNVTIPYKQAVISFLDELSDAASEIGAVNTIKVKNGYLKGYNTDALAFGKTLDSFLAKEQVNTDEISALILGTGGAALAVAWSLQQRLIPHRFVSRRPQPHQMNYSDISAETLQKFRLIINTTPLGMRPNVKTLPDIPYTALSKNNLLYDLVYNPEQTAFLQAGLRQGCATQNGLPMLYAQAEYAWDIWQSEEE